MKLHVMKPWLCVLFFFPVMLKAQDKIVIDVKLTGAPDGTVYYLRNDKNKIVDSALIQNEKLRFHHVVQSVFPISVTAETQDKSHNYFMWLDNNGPVSFWGVYGKKVILTAVGSQTQNDCKSHLDIIVPLQDSLKRMKNNINNLRKTSQAGIDSAESELAQFRKLVTAKEINFISTHRKSYWSAYIIMFETTQKNFTKEETAATFRMLHSDIQNSLWGSDVLKLLQTRQDVVIGKPAPLFTAQDIAGKKINLSDYTGKNVLLVFWASWCVPCRAEIPVIRKVYEKQRKEDFVILSVSVDEDPQEWKLASKNEKIQWQNLWHPGGWLSDPALAYGVVGIPRMFMIDKKGVLVEKEPDLGKLTDTKIN